MLYSNIYGKNQINPWDIKYIFIGSTQTGYRTAPEKVHFQPKSMDISYFSSKIYVVGIH